MVSTFYLHANDIGGDCYPTTKQSADTIYDDFADTYAKYSHPAEMNNTLVAGTTPVDSHLAESGSAHYNHLGSFITPPLAPQTISGTFTLILWIAEGNNSCNLYPKIKMYRWLANNTKGADIFEGTSSQEAPSSGGQTTFFSAQAFTETTLALGDRIVIEIEGYNNNTKTATYAQRFNIYNSSGGYIQFSGDVSIYVPTSGDIVGQVNFCRPTDLIGLHALLGDDIEIQRKAGIEGIWETIDTVPYSDHEYEDDG